MAKQELRDNRGFLLGWTETDANGLQVGRDWRGFLVGEYDPRGNVTRDKRGFHVGTGNLLSSLITRAR